MKTINNELIRSFRPCYDPSEKGIPDSETLPVRVWVEKYRAVVPAQDIVWLLCHDELLDKRDLRLFAVWCAREALKLAENPDPCSITACDVAERYANGKATESELQDAAKAAHDAYCAYATTRDAAYAALAATLAAAYAAASLAAYAADNVDAAREAQLEQLMRLF